MNPPLDLRFVILGGEALNVHMLQPWFQRFGDEHPQIVNMYGITETTVHVTYRRITSVDLNNKVHSPIGVPLPDLSIHLLDEQLQPVSRGMTGEMYIGGPGLAHGYLQQAGLTADRFIPNPFSLTSGARLYRSGDLAYRTASGDLYFVGRADQQVKIRGFRVELGEIETALHKHPGVRHAIVVASPFSIRDTHLIAYYVPSTNETDEAAMNSELKVFLEEQLPQYMIPSIFVAIISIPITANGKLATERLPRPHVPATETDTGRPPTSKERILMEVWKDVVCIDSIGCDTNFFDAGGTSLSIARIHAELRSRGEGPRSLIDFYRFPTIRLLAEHMEQSERRDRRLSDHPIEAPATRRRYIHIRRTTRAKIKKAPS